MADAPKSTPSPVQEGIAGERPLSTQDSALSASPSVLSPPSSVLEVFCPKCMYNLRGIDSERCPECGYSLSFLKIAESQIPWVHRKQIGRCRAYWRTVWWATFRRPKFGEELTRPMSLPDARRFHYVTLCHCYLAIAPLTALLAIAGPRSMQRAFQNHTTLAVCVALAVQFCALLVFVVFVRNAGDSIRNKNMPLSRQAQIVGLSYYAAGTLAWTFLPWPLSLVVFRLALAYEHVWYVGLAFLILGAVVLISPGLVGTLNMNYLERCVHRRSAAEKFKDEFKGALMGSVTLVIILVLPVAIAYVALIFYSLV